MPPISITKVLTAKQWEIQLAAMSDPHYNSTTNNEDDKYFAVEAYLRQTVNNKPLHVVEAGDIIVVTYDIADGPVDNDKTEIDELEKYIAKYGQDANGKPIYAIDNSLVGPYIVTIPTYDPELNINETSELNVQVQKLSFPDASIISVNNKSADEKGNVNLSLANILRDDVANTTIGKDLANAICSIVPSSVITGEHFSIYELAYDTQGEKIAVPYAKLKEVTDLSAVVFERFTLTDEKIDTINNDLINEIATLSGNVYEKIGNADQTAAEGDYELIINNSVLSQLKRIYGDLTIITTDITTLSGHVDTISGTVNANHDAFNTLKVTLKEDDVAGLQWFETNWENVLSGGTYIPAGELTYVSGTINDSSEDFIGQIDGLGGYSVSSLLSGQYVHTLKVPGDFQIIACYLTDTDNNKRLAYPDVVYSDKADDKANYISIVSENDKVVGTPWKIFVTKNIDIQ